jgi:methionine synthase II (cobalamin-independent)
VKVEITRLHLEGKDVLVGAIDVASDRVETPEEVARGKLKALAAGVALVRKELGARE